MKQKVIGLNIYTSWQANDFFIILIYLFNDVNI